jgi:hypothetical protein
MLERELTLAADGRTSLLPPGRPWDGVPMGRELDVDLQFVFDRRQGTEQLVLLRVELDVDVDGRLPPAEKHRGAATDQVTRAEFGRRGAESPHEVVDSL